MRRATLFLLVAAASWVTLQAVSLAADTVERLEPEIERLIPADAVVEHLAVGFSWAEGPVWDRRGRFLLFSDVVANAIFRWDDSTGVREFLRPSGYTGSVPRSDFAGSNGLATDSQGRLLICQQGDRRIVRQEVDGSLTVLVSQYEGKRLNSPNDLAVKSNGDIYFTDPPYGLPLLDQDPDKELPFNGVYRLSQDGRLTLLTTLLPAPNGIAFSPDEKTLYVSNSEVRRPIWMAFDVRPDGTISNGRLFADATGWDPGLKGVPDGIKVDTEGNLFTAGPGGILVFSPDGRLLGRVHTGEAANCAWGDNGSTLYITADSTLLRLKTGTQGFVLSPTRGKRTRWSPRHGM